MQTRVIHELLEADPFRPFTLFIGEGAEVHIDRPGRVRIETDTAYISDGEGRVYVVDLRLVPMVDVQPGRQSGGGY